MAKTGKRNDSKLLLEVAQRIASDLKLYKNETHFRIRLPSHVDPRTTGGWRAVIGNMGVGMPRLEIWFDRIAGYQTRKFYAGIVSENANRILAITKKVGKDLWPIRKISSSDLSKDKLGEFFSTRIRRQEFNLPVFEDYSERAYYGVFDPTRMTSNAGYKHFHDQAIAFFLDVAQFLPASQANETCSIYPKCENRKIAEAHVRRERSRFLGLARKEKDNFTCQICGFRFEDTYGTLGNSFAEAHHRVPLCLLKENVKTDIDDLITVCANCHRMLHRMDGKRNDIEKLKKLVNRKKQAN